MTPSVVIHGMLWPALASASVILRTSPVLMTASALDVATELPLLPVDVDGILLPGDVRRFELQDIRHLELVEQALVRSDRCFAQLPVVSNSGQERLRNGVYTVAEWMPLLQIDAASYVPGSVSAVVTCTGRVQLRCADKLYVAPHDDGIVTTVQTGAVTSYVDEKMTSAQLGESRALLCEIEDLRRSCAQLDVPLIGSLDRPTASALSVLRAAEQQPLMPPPPPAAAADLSNAPLTEQARQLHMHLACVGVGAPGYAEALHDLWEVSGEAEAQLQLASFVACGWFGRRTRTYAAQCKSTPQRLRLVRDALLERERRAVAVRALRGVLDEVSSEGEKAEGEEEATPPGER